MIRAGKRCEFSGEVACFAAKTLGTTGEGRTGQLTGEWTVEELKKCLRWIHCELAEAEFAALFRDVSNRFFKLPSVIRRDGETVAASYFKLLGGGVATLGGVRAARGHEQVALELLQQQISQMRAADISQIQAVLVDSDSATTPILRAVGFQHLTHIEHQWLDVSSTHLRSAENPGHQDLDTANGQRWRWTPAHQFARPRIETLIQATFEKTLDCPAMNNMRSSRQVLEGFLEGRSFREIGVLWEVLVHRGCLVGCLLLAEHEPHLMELVYLGLVLEVRGRGLGDVLVNRAVKKSQLNGCRTLVVAVDEKNWPALKLYRNVGFQRHQRLGVWMLPK